MSREALVDHKITLRTVPDAVTGSTLATNSRNSDLSVPESGSSEAVQTFYTALFDDRYSKAVEYLPYEEDPARDRNGYINLLNDIETSRIDVKEVRTISERRLEIDKNTNEYVFCWFINDKSIYTKKYESSPHLGEVVNNLNVDIEDSTFAVNQTNYMTTFPLTSEKLNVNPSEHELWSPITFESKDMKSSKEIWDEPSSELPEMMFLKKGMADVSSFPNEAFMLFLWGCDVEKSPLKEDNWRYLSPRIFKKSKKDNNFGKFINDVDSIEVRALQTKLKIDRTDLEAEPTTITGQVIVYRIDTEGWYVGGLLPRYKENTVNKPLPPEANFTYSPENPVVGQKITFDASQSNDSDGSIRRFEWDLNADNGFEKQGKKISYSFNNPGTHRVRLRVTDDSGATAVQRIEVSVQSSNINTANDTSSITPPTPESPTSPISRERFELPGKYYRSIQFDNSTYFVHWELPNQPPYRLAIVDQSENLVDPETAKNIIVSNTHLEHISVEPWQRFIREAKNRRNYYKAWEGASRLSTIGIDALETFALGTLSPLAALPLAYQTLKDSISWTLDEVDSPYKESLLELKGISGASLQYERRVKRLATVEQLPQEALDWIELAIDGAGQVENFVDIGKIGATMARVVNTSDDVTVALTAGGSATVIPLATLVFSLGVEHGVKVSTQPFEIHAKTAGIGVALNTLLLPVYQKLKPLQKSIITGTASPADIARYWRHRITTHQMIAVAHEAMSRYEGRLSEQPLGPIWNVLENAETLEKTLEKSAQKHFNLSMYYLYRNGQIWDLARRQAKRSVNYELNGGRA